MNLNPPTEHQLLVFWFGLLVILVTARVLGTFMQRIGQPSVVGELAAGLVLGPSLLGKITPGVFDWLFPADDAQTAMLFTVGWLGVMLLLVATGFETDLGLIGRLGRAATFVSAGSLIVPAAAGLLVGWFIPEAFVGDGTQRYIFAMFIATALSISSLPVIAKILSEMGLMRRNFGQLTLAAGMANDVVGWVALGFIAGLAQAGGVDLGKLAFTVGGLIIFFIAAFTIGQRGVDAALRRVRANGEDPLSGLTVILITALTFGVITQWLHVEAVLGAFVAGVILARSRFGDHELIKPLETMTAAIFAPAFFATAGLRVDVGLLADTETFVWAGLVLLAASLSKFLGAIIGARMSLLPIREGAALGVGLNARGALEIVIATVGLSLGVLNDRSYTVIVLMAMATSMLAPPLLRKVLAGWEGDPEERRRIDLETQLAANTVVTGGRVLLPTTGGLSSLLAAQLVGLTWPEQTEITLFTAGDTDVDNVALRNVLPNHQVRHITDTSGDGVAPAILAEARLGYDAVVMGSALEPESANTLSCLVTAVSALSPVHAVVVRRPEGSQLPWAFARAVVPLSGSMSSRGAQEISAYLSSNIGTHLHQLHVHTNEHPTLNRVLADHGPTSQPVRNVLHGAAEFATAAGANHTTTSEPAANAAVHIAASVKELGADLVIASGTNRGHHNSLFLGHTIDHLLHEVDTTLVLAIAPADHDENSATDPDETDLSTPTELTRA